MFSRITSVLSYFWKPLINTGENVETAKRKRVFGDCHDKSEDSSPPKKIKFHGILSEKNNQEDMNKPIGVWKPQLKVSRPAFPPGNFSSGPSNSNEGITENLPKGVKTTGQDADMSPISKNKYKPPAHCRSPGRGVKPSNVRPLFASKTDDDVEYVKTIHPPKTQERTTPPCRNRSILKKSMVTPRSLKRNEALLKDYLRKQNMLAKGYDLESRQMYSILLGSLIKEPFKYPHFRVDPVKIDLTGSDSDDDVIEVTSQTEGVPTQPSMQAGLNKSTQLPLKENFSHLRNENVSLRKPLSHSPKKPLSSPAEFVDLTIKKTPKPKIVTTIDLVTDDSDIQVIESTPVTPVNTLEERLKAYPFTSEDWVSSFAEKHSLNTSQINEVKARFEKEYKILQETKQEQINDILEKELRKHLKITEVTIDEIEDSALPELSPEVEDIVDEAFARKNPNDVIVEKFGYVIRRRDIHTLIGRNWLNDEVINFYMTLLMERGKDPEYPNVYAFNTFFYPRYLQSGHSGVRRWTRKVDIFSYEFIIVPVHLRVHWCMASIDLKKKVINYYDSMGSSNNQCLKALLTYLEEEMKDKKKEVFDTSGWQTNNVKDIPQQMNDSDCGVFACMFAEFICRKAEFSFDQSNMHYFRKKMAYEIISGKLMM